MTERGRLRRRWVLAGAAAVAVIVGGVNFVSWWKWDHTPARVPESACWSVLTKDDLKPFADQAHGTFFDDPGLKDHPRLQPDHGYIDCVLREKSEDGKGDSLLWVQVRAVDDSDVTYRYGPDGLDAKEGFERLDFGADVQGWVRRQTVHAVVRCDNPEIADLRNSYVMVGVASGTAIDVTSKEAHQAVLDVALKYVKAVVASYPCSNPLRLPDVVPRTPTNFPPLDH